MSTIEEARERLRIPQLWRMLGLRGEPAAACCSPLREDRHPSFSIFDEGRRFKDFGRPEHHGDAVDFLAIARGISTSESARELIRLAGVAPEAPAATAETAPKATESRALPADVASSWQEGLAFLRSSREQQERIARWRGWTADFVATLAEDGFIAMPMHRGVRGVGFPVQCPDRGETIGYHCRFPAGGGRAQWAFVPSGLPALPFIVGTFQGARLLVIAEGQWDALTFCHAAGWFGHDAAWPGEVVVIGIRGASGWRGFLKHFDPHWPKPHPNCLLLPDRDAAGAAWTQGRGATFLEELRRRCRSVAVQCCVGAKDLNDLHRAQPITAAEIGRIFLGAGLTDKRGRVL